jgi:hypothetical protein
MVTHGRPDTAIRGVQPVAFGELHIQRRVGVVPPALAATQPAGLGGDQVDQRTGAV